MTASVLQFATNSQASGASSFTVSMSNTTAGSAFLVDIFWWTNAGVTVSSITDTQSNTYGAIQSVGDGNFYLAQWRAYNIVGGAGSNTVTVNWSGGNGTMGLALREVGGVKTSSAVDGFTGQINATPGTGTDATSSGNATSSNQPAILLGTCVNRSAANNASAGTGFTSNGTGTGYYANYPFRCESKRVTSTGNQAATFTAPNGTDNFITLVTVMDEISGKTAARHYYDHLLRVR